MRLKENIKFEELEKYGFIEDPVNCELGTHIIVVTITTMNLIIVMVQKVG